MVVHQEYGEQFKIDAFEKIMPQTLEALISYLGSGAIKGVGPATAKKIVDKFGEETIAIIKMHPEKLSIIRGITKTKAIEIAEEFMEFLSEEITRIMSDNIVDEDLEAVKEINN